MRDLIPVQDCDHPNEALTYRGEQQMSIEHPAVTKSLHRCGSCGTAVVKDAPVGSSYEWEWAARHLAAQLLAFCPAEALDVLRRSLSTLAENDVSLKLAGYAVRDHAAHSTSAAA